jgi:hypothetical protein
MKKIKMGHDRIPLFGLSSSKAVARDCLGEATTCQGIFHAVIPFPNVAADI